MPSGEYTNNINYYDIDYLDLLDDIPYKYIKSIVKQNKNEDDWVDFDFEVEIEDAVPTSEDRQMCSIKISFELEINVSNGSLPLMTTKSFVVIKEYHANSPMAMYVGENLWRWDEEDEDEDDDDDDDEEDDDDDEDVDADEPPQEPPQEPQQDDTDDDDDDDDDEGADADEPPNEPPQEPQEDDTDAETDEEGIEINVYRFNINEQQYLRAMPTQNTLNIDNSNDIYDIDTYEYLGQYNKNNNSITMGAVSVDDISSVINVCV